MTFEPQADPGAATEARKRPRLEITPELRPLWDELHGAACDLLITHGMEYLGDGYRSPQSLTDWPRYTDDERVDEQERFLAASEAFTAAVKAPR